MSQAVDLHVLSLHVILALHSLGIYGSATWMNWKIFLRTQAINAYDPYLILMNTCDTLLIISCLIPQV